MPRKPSRKTLIKKLDALFSQYVRKKNADKNDMCTCVTCKQKIHYKEIQAGHFMSRKHYSTRWDIDNVHPQCVACNVFKYGEQYKYSLFLGERRSKLLYLKSQKIVKFSNADLQEMLDEFKLKLSNLT